jgi:putative photosynthetic complex assembly protein 2
MGALHGIGLHPLASPAGAAAYTLFVWWFSTGAILWLNRRPVAAYPLILGLASVLALAAGAAALELRDVATGEGALFGFTAGLALWGWHELSFLMGVVTGPRRLPCPEDALGWRRFRLAAGTLIYHEGAIAATAVALGVLTLGHANPMAFFTFLTLMGARLSAKFNLFAGVPNFTDAFLPERLAHLKTYLRTRPAGALLELSLGLLALTAGLEAGRAFDLAAPPFERTAFTLLLVLTLLALAEHVFLILPLQEGRLWRWAFPAAERNLVSRPFRLERAADMTEPSGSAPSFPRGPLYENKRKGAPAHGL